MEQKKIILLIPSLGQGGAEKVFSNLSNHWATRGYEVCIVTQYDNLTTSFYLNEKIIQKKISKHFLVGLVQFIFVTSKLKPDFVISTLNITNIINYFASKLSFAKYKVVIRQASPIQFHKLPKIVKLLLIKSFNNSDILICNSNTTKSSLLNYVNSNIIRVIPNPVFTNSFYDKANETNVLPFYLEDKKFILCVGRLEKVKNFTLAIEAFSKSKLSKEFHLIILGEGIQRENLQEFISGLKISNRVHLLGNYNNPYPFYKKASLFVSCSLWEGFGNVLVEALAFNLPIIATPSGASEEVLQGGRYGEILKNFESSQLAEKFNHFLSNPYVADTNGYAKNFELSNVSDEYLKKILLTDLN